MVYSMIFSGITSVMGALVMAFCAGDWETYMESEYDPTHLNREQKLTWLLSFPFVDWFVDILGSSAGGSALVIVVIVLLKFVPGKQL